MEVLTMFAFSFKLEKENNFDIILLGRISYKHGLSIIRKNCLYNINSN